MTIDEIVNLLPELDPDTAVTVAERVSAFMDGTVEYGVRITLSEDSHEPGTTVDDWLGTREKAERELANFPNRVLIARRKAGAPFLVR